MESAMDRRHGAIAVILAGWTVVAVACAQPPASSPPQKMEPVNDPAATSPAKPEAPPASKPETKPGATPPASDPADPTKTMEELERAAKSRPGGGTPGASGAAGATGAAAASAVQPAVRPFARLMREGAFLTSKRGRMVKSPEGEWLFVFDNDADSRAYPAMVLVPCLNLAAMERIAERAGDSATMTVSGQVFVYKGKNHLLPSLYTVDRKTELAPNG